MRYRDEPHLKYIRSLACVICGDDTSVEACHIRFADASLVKATGIAIKPDDYWVLPMCSKHHRLQHSGNERKFWNDAGIDACLYALRLFSVSGDYEAGLAILKAANHGLDRCEWKSGQTAMRLWKKQPRWSSGSVIMRVVKKLRK